MKLTRIIPVLLALATGALAQETPAKLALAHEVITAMKADKMFDGMAAQMKQMSGPMTSLPADATPEQRRKAEELQGRIMDFTVNFMKEMLAKMDHVYAEVYSEAELRAIKSFFTSPEGQSMMDKQPQLMAKMMPIIQEMQRDMLPKMQQLMKDPAAAK